MKCVWRVQIGLGPVQRDECGGWDEDRSIDGETRDGDPGGETSNKRCFELLLGKFYSRRGTVTRRVSGRCRGKVDLPRVLSDVERYQGFWGRGQEKGPYPVTSVDRKLQETTRFVEGRNHGNDPDGPETDPRRGPSDLHDRARGPETRHGRGV